MSRPAQSPAAKPRPDFVELGRTFHQLSKYAHEDDDVDLSHVFRVGDTLRWRDLLTKFRLVILSEAGSGKTTEIRNTARRLRKEGKAAFFLRLENIPRDFEDAFEVGSYTEFQEWLASGDEAWLLLDSVDEARLRDPGDFELAIRKLGRHLVSATDRAHIIITGRTFAWRPKTDLAHCTTHLPYSPSVVTEDQTNEDHSSDDNLITSSDDEVDGAQIFEIISFDDLSRDQVQTFVHAHGVSSSNAFLEAVERADAWSFTARPLDLEELVGFWIDKGRIGSRLEIMQNSISRRLTERDPTRADARPLSVQAARQGAMVVAAGATLVQQPAIRVPDGSTNNAGMPVQELLPDWDEKLQSTLLSRPVFDEAIYGAVRFHHRSVKEYLTAEWFCQLLQQETARRKVEGLFFRNQYGMDIIVPSLRPILPWLAILDDKIRNRVQKIAPEIFFEGGDPSQLPLNVRSQILRDVCEQMATTSAARSARDYSAVQRFANPDLTDDVRQLIKKYEGRSDLTSFLLRMVWLGQLSAALPEAMKIALSATAENYERRAAIRAVKAVGTSEDQKNLRHSFLKEAATLNREWFSELLSDLYPDETTLDWMLACLAKSEDKEAYSVDSLTEVIQNFIDKAEVKFLAGIVVAFESFLNTPPVIERRFCEVSERFQWLLPPAAKAVERLVVSRDVALLSNSALSILHKLSTAKSYGSDHIHDVKLDFETLVSAWPELNRAYFWFAIEQARKNRDKKNGERVTDFWMASIFGSYWRFTSDDWGYVLDQISSQHQNDNKLVALSLAWDLYKQRGRSRSDREKLKGLVTGNPEMSERLRNFLKPPPQTLELRRLKSQNAMWARRHAKRIGTQDRSAEKSKKYLLDHLEDIKKRTKEKPGELSNAFLYLLDHHRKEDISSSRWSNPNWQKLIPEFGESVALAYRNGAVAFWRAYKPKLRSEGAPFNTTPSAVVFGLTGLEIDAGETKSWACGLSEDEARLACRYASFELNGFPTWFPMLFGAHPKIVGDFLISEISFELTMSEEKTNLHYILDDVSWSGHWAWDQIAKHVVGMLSTNEPLNLENLIELLKIIQGSSLSDEEIATLAAEKCEQALGLHHLGCWYAVWVGAEPVRAIPALHAKLREMDGDNDKTELAMVFVTHLWSGRRSEGTSVRHRFHTPVHLKSLYLLMLEYIRQKDDVERAGKGVYSPDLRDNAQNARNSIYSELDKIPGKDSFLALVEIANLHPDRPWLMLHAKARAEQDGDSGPWKPKDVPEFQAKIERTPTNHRELAELAIFRLLELKDDLENGDSSIAGILKRINAETDMRKFIGNVLRDKALGRYSIPQEEELADAKKPDFRMHGAGFDAPLPVELKIANKWSGPDLFERLENQLCGDYLRDRRSNRGIFLLVRTEDASVKHWQVPRSKELVNFNGLISALQDHWTMISPRFSGVDDIVVIGIDLTMRGA